MAKQTKIRLRLTVKCKNREQVVLISKELMNQFASHYTTIGGGKKLVSMHLMPLDETLFDHQESISIIGQTLRHSLPNDLKWSLSIWKKTPNRQSSNRKS